MFQSVKDVQASSDALHLFEFIGKYVQRLDIYTKIPPTTVMTKILVKIVVELLSTLALATKQIKQGRLSEFTPPSPERPQLSATQGNSARSC